MSEGEATDAKHSWLQVVAGGRCIREEQLLREFMHPGVDNLDRVRLIPASLAPRGKLGIVGNEDERPVDE